MFDQPFSAFDELGRPDNAGLCFAVTRKALDEHFGGEFANCPVPPYEHAVFRCHSTDNYLVVRPDLNGTYDVDCFADLERVR